MFTKYQCLVVALHLLLPTESSANTHCSTREFAGYNGTVKTGEGCPYMLEVDSWSPGKPATMELAHMDNEPFQLFLVSVQLGNSLIGEMRPADHASMVTCGTTSIQHADDNDKMFTTFTWTAPSDITETEVIIRTSVGTDREFWKDCEAFYYERAPEADTTSTNSPTTTTTTNLPTTTTTTNSPTSTTTTAARASPTTTEQDATSRRVAGPDRVNDGTTVTAAPVGSASQSAAPSCKAYGNIYTLVADSDCKQFKQSVEGMPYMGSHMHNCPGGTRFDTDKCSCSFMLSSNCKM